MEKSPEPDSEAFARDFSSFHGGSASNFAVGVSRLGIRSGMVGCVGSDRFGEEAIRALQREGVATDLVKVIKGDRTGAVCVLVDTDGKRMMVAYRGANMRLPEAVEGVGEAMPDVLQVSNVSRALLKKILGEIKGKKKKTLVSLDPGGSSCELTVGDLEGVEVLLLNEKECGTITKKSLRQGSEVLREKVKTVVIKRGRKGCLLLSERGMEEVRAFPVDVQDPTGAGDAFDAGFIAGILSGKNAREAAIWGSAVAAMKLFKKGAWAGLPSKQELLEFLRTRHAETGFSEVS